MATPDLGVSNARRTVNGAFLAASFRTPARALAAGGSQTLMTLFNGSGATASQLIAIRRIAVEVDSIVARTTLSPWVRARRVSAVTASTGTTLTPAPLDLSNAPTLAVTIFQDASADGTNSSTQLASTQLSGATDLWQQVVPRMATQVGLWNPDSLTMLPDDGGWTDDNPLILRASQGVQVRVDAPAAVTAADFHFGVKVAFEQFAFG